LGRVDSASLVGDGFFTELPCHLPPGVVGELLDRGEIEVIRGTVGPEKILCERCEKLLEAWVEWGISR
jgi:hypothetical protein